MRGLSALIASRRRLGRQALARRALCSRCRGLIQRGFRVLVNAGPGEEPMAEVIETATGGAASPFTHSLAQLIALTRRIALCVAGDTGPLHLACALGRPVVGIYGPTDPSRNGPSERDFECCAAR